MPVRTPHFPDLLFRAAGRLRRWETALMTLLEQAGCREMHPSMVMRDPVPEGALRFFDGEDLVALRWDFTVALAGVVTRRFPEPPGRISYAGPVFRRPVQPWEAVERFEVGCEFIQNGAEANGESDLELARLLMAVPGAIGLKNAIIHLGNAALVRRPMEAEQLSPEQTKAVVSALSRRAPHRVLQVLEGHPAAERLTAHAQALVSELGGAEALKALDASPYADLLKDDRRHMEQALRSLLPILPPNLELRLDLADVEGLDFYTGPTLRLWAPGAQQELASGGRYDGLYPELGKPWQAAGFCVRISRLLDLAETRPDLFEQP
ncbi:ATP phosphoribosyltransferase regulatory subunit [Holophaga foetida]|uniref:ATP phosphoribosyltransferase regulatory subunit n=1 Tax=Holophaga foetida TaxID=35839 RepID=UPI0002471CCE|nr:ATP phosphoribosyltransferase regulatory subunit [Holophaga foetida]